MDVAVRAAAVVGSVEDREGTDVGSRVDLDAGVRGHDHFHEADGIGEHHVVRAAVEGGAVEVEHEVTDREPVPTVEVTDRGRPVALLLKTMPSGLARLEREGLLRRAEADLLDLVPVRLPPDATPPSRLVSEGRAD